MPTDSLQSRSFVDSTSATISLRQHPEVKELWRIGFVVYLTIGLGNGLYLSTWGPYFYQHFGGTLQPSTAILLTAILLGLRQGLVALLEIPTGAYSDAVGRVHAVNLSWIARVMFFVCLSAIWLCDSVATAFTWGIFSSIFFSLSYTLFNGAFSAWCVDTLRERAPQVNYGWLISRLTSYRHFAEIFGGFIAIYCYLKGVAFLSFLLGAGLSFCCFSYCATRMEEVKSLRFLKTSEVQFSVITRRIGEIIGRATQLCIKTPVLFWVTLTFSCFLFLRNVIDYLWPVYLKTKFGLSETLGRDWMLLMAGSLLITVLGARILVWLNQRWSGEGKRGRHVTGFRRIYVATGLVAAMVTLLLSWDTAFHSFNSTFLFPLVVAICTAAYGIMNPAFEMLINTYIPPEDAQHRATVMSAGSMFRSLLILVLAIPSGGSSGEKSPIGWAIPAALLLISAVLANGFMRRASRSKIKLVSELTPTKEVSS